MDTNKLSITINKPVSEVFEFTLNPKNTPKWIETMMEEKTDTENIKVGTKYSNTNDGITWTEYLCSLLQKDTLFELQEVGGSYRVKYTYVPISTNETELAYIEWTDDKSELSKPLEMKALEKLKSAIETQ
jgi:CRISPR/Cas system CSM-associated protein Csm3 (group 7 of RAMP superfamily)